MRSFQRILALTDLSEASVAGLDLADKLAHRFHAHVVAGYVHTRTDVLRGFEGDQENASRLAEWVRRDDEEHLKHLVRDHVDRLRLDGIETVEVGSAREGVHLLADRVKPDLICMATHGRTGLKHMLLGSIAEHTIRTARVPVAVSKGARLPPLDRPLRVMVALDLIDDPNALVRRAAALLQPSDRLLLAHVVESIFLSPAAYGSEFALPQPDVPRLQQAAEMRLRDIVLDNGAPVVEVRVVVGRPGDELVALEDEWGAHLTIARTHGRRGFDHLMLGSVSEHLARRCSGAVLVLPKIDP